MCIKYFELVLVDGNLESFFLLFCLLTSNCLLNYTYCIEHKTQLYKPLLVKHKYLGSFFYRICIASERFSDLHPFSQNFSVTIYHTLNLINGRDEYFLRHELFVYIFQLTSSVVFNFFYINHVLNVKFDANFYDSK